MVKNRRDKEKTDKDNTEIRQKYKIKIKVKENTRQIIGKRRHAEATRNREERL